MSSDRPPVRSVVDGDAHGTGRLARYEFIEALCGAIDAYCDAAEGADGGAFTHRGANLRWAVERDLFVRLVHLDSMRRLFEGKPTKTGSPLERALAPFLAPGAGGAAARDRVELLVRRLRGWLPRARPPGQAREVPRGVEVLAHVIHPKFVRYLDPISRALPTPLAYLLGPVPALHAEIAARGNPVVWWGRARIGRARPGLWLFPHLTEWFDRLHAALAAARPRCVLLVEGNAPHDEVVNQATRLLGIPTLCLQHGWSPIVHNGFRDLSFDAMLTWGDGFAELLQPFSPGQRFITVGNPALSAQAGPTGSAISFFLQPPGLLMEERVIAEFLRLIEETAARYPFIPIVVREHPSHTLTAAERAALHRLGNVRLSTGAAEPLEDVLRASRLSVSIFSSTILESIAAGVPPLVVNLGVLPRFSPDVDDAGAGVEVSSVAAALEMIGEAAENPRFAERFEPAMTRFRARYFAEPNARTPIERIVAAIQGHARAPQNAAPGNGR
jgi:hypothetical protein